MVTTAGRRRRSSSDDGAGLFDRPFDAFRVRQARIGPFDDAEAGDALQELREDHLFLMSVTIPAVHDQLQFLRVRDRIVLRGREDLTHVLHGQQGGAGRRGGSSGGGRSPGRRGIVIIVIDRRRRHERVAQKFCVVDEIAELLNVHHARDGRCVVVTTVIVVVVVVTIGAIVVVQ